MTHSVTMTVIQPDGSTGRASERDQQLLTQVQSLLAKDPHFQTDPQPS